MWNVWRTVLEENEKLARARLAAVEVFQQQIAEEAKVLRSHKVAASKKVSKKKTQQTLFHSSSILQSDAIYIYRPGEFWPHTTDPITYTPFLILMYSIDTSCVK